MDGGFICERRVLGALARSLIAPKWSCVRNCQRVAATSRTRFKDFNSLYSTSQSNKAFMQLIVFCLTENQNFAVGIHSASIEEKERNSPNRNWVWSNPTALPNHHFYLKQFQLKKKKLKTKYGAIESRGNAMHHLSKNQKSAAGTWNVCADKEQQRTCYLPSCFTYEGQKLGSLVSEQLLTIKKNGLHTKSAIVESVVVEKAC